jgi:hypothetical protein
VRASWKRQHCDIGALQRSNDAFATSGRNFAPRSPTAAMQASLKKILGVGIKLEPQMKNATGA